MGGSVSIVLPAYNEEKAIGGVIDEVKETMAGAGKTSSFSDSSLLPYPHWKTP